MKKNILFILLFSAKTFAQQIENLPNFWIKSYHFSVQKGKKTLIDLPSQTTSIVFENLEAIQLKTCILQTETETIQLKIDEHSDQKNSSELIVFDKPVTSFYFYSEQYSGNFNAKIVYVKPLILNELNQNFKLSACDKPVVVPIATWRTGLTPPKEKPVQSVVKHLIVHHAAGSNMNTNFTDVVRNIYVYHTQSNGWNDVGYNFLIAQDGTIFEGRDGQGLADGDNVVGAHFCSQNTNTMGICMLGDYMLVQPPQKAIDALAKLMAWKAEKEKIDPLTKTIHAASGKNLFNISSHRDGSCATDCPGDNLYAKLIEIRQNTLNACAGGVQPPVVIVPPVIPPVVVTGFEDNLNLIERVFPNPSNGQVILETKLPTKMSNIRLLDNLGREITIKIEEENPKKFKCWIADLAKGTYFLRIEFEVSSVTKKIMIVD